MNRDSYLNFLENFNISNEDFIEYGLNDIPLIVQDRLFVDGKMTYTSDHRVGYLGNTILVNGTPNAFKKVPIGWVRFRVLNASNARFYNFNFEDNRNFQVIATEGGFLDRPVTVKNLEVWPGERFEIMVNFSNSSSIKFMAISNNRRQSESFEIIEFRPDESISSQGELPTQLNSITPYDASQAENIREFRFNMDGVEGGMMGINGFAMNMKVINERVQKNNLKNERELQARLTNIDVASLQNSVAEDQKSSGLQRLGELILKQAISLTIIFLLL